MNDPIHAELERIIAKKHGVLTPEDKARREKEEREHYMARGSFFHLQHRAKEGSFWWKHKESAREWSGWGHHPSKSAAIDRAKWADQRYAGNVFRIVDIRDGKTVWDNIGTSSSSTKSSE